ncbi:pyridoxamine 5'-phosphate oxidase [Halalkalicoccus paucihalophilus]|uniref:Pyridoxamine 5'-phosphate oxidase n=1 Tax=Halalkalicoccus paucihalophilus TaxID=1008153 RepID=A0A151AJ76_9EURY|nr:pyridoxamine 5'-phosphate oxidase family protein [Halalkalicoccus paucihalophilus]KYH27683.1 pyridoxamine 5'-phosphate oxidase [Halalkalicoccus paucihalophilus]
MELVEDTLAVDLDTFLARPLFCFLATESPDGPRVSPLWYLWEEGAVWIAVNPELKSYPDRIESDPRTALAVVDFDASRGLVQHVGMRGTASIEAFDPEKATRLFGRYLGPEEGWDGRFHAVFERNERYRLVKFEPGTVVARDQSYAPAGPL